MGVPRRVVQIAAAQESEAISVLYALADDGSLWSCYVDATDPEWVSVPALPAADSCPATSHAGNKCRLVQGHRDNHWDGSRRWG